MTGSNLVREVAEVSTVAAIREDSVIG